MNVHVLQDYITFAFYGFILVLFLFSPLNFYPTSNLSRFLLSVCADFIFRSFFDALI